MRAKQVWFAVLTEGSAGCAMTCVGGVQPTLGLNLISDMIMSDTWKGGGEQMDWYLHPGGPLYGYECMRIQGLTAS